SFADSITIINSFFVGNYHEIFGKHLYTIGLEENEFLVLVLSILGLTYFEYIHKKHNMALVLSKQSTIFRWSTYLTIAIVITIFGVYGSDLASEFIYFQF